MENNINNERKRKSTELDEFRSKRIKEKKNTFYFTEEVSDK